MYDFYSDNRISSSACGSGYTGMATTGDISSTFINPASLSLENKKQIYFEYVYKDEIEWILDIKYKNLNPNFSLGFGLPVNDYFQTGITYRTEKSFKIDYEEITQMIVSDTAVEGYVETGSFNLNTNFKITSFSIPIVFKFKDMFNIGVDISYTNFYYRKFLEEEADSLEAVPNTHTVDFYIVRPKFGIIVSPLENLSMGFTYLPESKETVTHAINPVKFPLKIGTGIRYQLSTIPLTLSLDYNFSKNSAEEGLVNRNDIHFGVSYDIHNNFILRGGLFTQGDYRNNDPRVTEQLWGIVLDDQIFTTFGISYEVNSLTLILSFMDSHLLSDGQIKQTYVNTGISYGF